MSVYVDDQRRKFGKMTMCHMIADSTSELLAMADVIGVDRRHIQYAGTAKEHFDICLSKRDLAIENGATAITLRESGRIVAAKIEALKAGVVCR